MPAVTRVTQDTAGGILIGGGNHHVYCNGTLVTVLGDLVAPHGPGIHAGPVMAQASSTVFINGIPICRQGDQATCGHPATGSPNVSAG